MLGVIICTNETTSYWSIRKNLVTANEISLHQKLATSEFSDPNRWVLGWNISSSSPLPHDEGEEVEQLKQLIIVESTLETHVPSVPGQLTPPEKSEQNTSGEKSMFDLDDDESIQGEHLESDPSTHIPEHKEETVKEKSESSKHIPEHKDEKEGPKLKEGK
ncbi:17636_t:CDS:2 [Acaulospora colombiana]|uniref:17636_t:CDS:1 n=1 Tax=Acaulospora colombiana TaxID=27376 RepID=A0ACA9KJF3_9GLOM|nr:17636_t:CDS:2 [Acaulospora colombiana]